MPGALALALSLTGCGAAVSVLNDSQNAQTKKLLASLKFKRSTLTRKQLGETYPERAWSIVRQPFAPAYSKITEADAFEWEYLVEVQAKRRGLFARQEKIDAAKRRQARKLAEKARRIKAKADARAQAEAKKAEAIKNAELAPATSPPSSE